MIQRHIGTMFPLTQGNQVFFSYVPIFLPVPLKNLAPPSL